MLAEPDACMQVNVQAEEDRKAGLLHHERWEVSPHTLRVSMRLSAWHEDYLILLVFARACAAGSVRCCCYQQAQLTDTGPRSAGRTSS